MAIFDDTVATKLVVLDKGYQKSGDLITLRQGETTTPTLDGAEPLAVEAQHFIECIRTGARPISDGEAGTQVVSVLVARRDVARRAPPPHDETVSTASGRGW